MVVIMYTSCPPSDDGSLHRPSPYLQVNELNLYSGLEKKHRKLTEILVYIVAICVCAFSVLHEQW